MNLFVSLVGLVIVLMLSALWPFPILGPILTILRAIFTMSELSFVCRVSLSRHLFIDLLVSPLFTIMHVIDEILFPGYRRSRINAPIFIVGQPRSGTTFLHRTLSLSEEFVSLKHLEWRIPFICAWKLIDLMGLRAAVESLNYWPKDRLGEAASRMHPDRLGDFEEHGVFLEERLYSHYFLFRRYPLNAVLRMISNTQELPARRRRQILRLLTIAVQKAIYYRGTSQVWLTKENESVDLHRFLAQVFPDARWVFLVRRPEGFVNSYVSLSASSTMAKTGLDPGSIPGWHEANLAFRSQECLKMIVFSREIQATHRAVMVSYERLMADIPKCIGYICEELGIPISTKYSLLLDELQREQLGRDRGYSYEVGDTAGFEFFAYFVAMIERRYDFAQVAKAETGRAIDLALATLDGVGSWSRRRAN